MSQDAVRKRQILSKQAKAERDSIAPVVVKPKIRIAKPR